MKTDKDFSFAMTVFILVESSILLVLQFALNPVFRAVDTPPEISVSLTLPANLGGSGSCVCPEITCKADEKDS